MSWNKQSRFKDLFPGPFQRPRHFCVQAWQGERVCDSVKKRQCGNTEDRVFLFLFLLCVHNFGEGGGHFSAVIDEQRTELNRWHRGTPQSIILSHGFTFHHLLNPHTHIHTCTWSAHNISGCEKEAS